MRSALPLGLCLCVPLLGPLGCADDSAAEPAPLFPTEYAASYTEVRGCRASTEHDFARVRVLADPDAVGPYLARDRDFPVGAVVLKAEYDFADPTCQGPIARWTVMVREAAGSSPEALDWHWQDVSANRQVKTENEARCIGCHTGCGVPPEGYLGTCTVEASGDALR